MIVTLLIATYIALGFLTVLVGLRSGEIVKSDRGLLFGTIFTWPLVWFILAFLTVVDRLGPIFDTAVNNFIDVLVKIAEKGKNKDV